MKRITLIILLSSALTVSAQEEIVLKGNYTGNNLYVMNPSVGTDDYCVTEVLVNGSLTKDEVNSNSFEVDFSLLELKIGDAVTVIIKHPSGCKPQVINPLALVTIQEFLYTSAKFDKAGKVTWSVKGEMGENPFVVEQFRWKKWVQIGEVPVNDSIKFNQYALECYPHLGNNLFRVVLIDVMGNPQYSKQIKYYSRNPEVTLVSTKVTDKISFSGVTMYEIFDTQGNFLMEGVGQEVDVTDLEKGKYWLNYDAVTVQFTKK